MARYGGQIGENGHYRVYGKYFDRGPFPARISISTAPPLPGPETTSGTRGAPVSAPIGSGPRSPERFYDTGRPLSGHRKADRTRTLTPRLYMATLCHRENVLARWRHVYDDDHDWTLQAYYDYAQRDTILNDERVRTTDIDYVYRFPFNERNQITCGPAIATFRTTSPATIPISPAIPRIETTISPANRPG